MVTAQSAKQATIEERRRLARKMLLSWRPRVEVVDALCERFGIAKTAAYEDIASVWDDIAAAQRSTRDQQLARALALIETQIAEVADSGEPATARAQAINHLVDRLAKLGGLYPEAKRTIAGTWAMLAKIGGDAMRVEAMRAAQLGDADLEAAIAQEQRRLGLGIADDDVLALVQARFGDAAAMAVREVGRPVQIAAAGRVVVTESRPGGLDADPDDR